ncbi:hypothetical protein MTN95_04740 [Bacillus sp. 2CMS4F]|uniref:hypothetical protein n=1 Tax=Bacillus sp. 2CMS4F TaxID=2929170 RepID=UPI0020BDBBF0|nr:hypothetical protein [Bacillus sp. 2CMS4F]MCK8098700.1 hypothetical protein [Bacillus sp. 2CMS4F]
MSKKRKRNLNFSKKVNKEKLKELEEVIYTNSEKDLLAHFLEEFRHGEEMSYYKERQSLIYELDIECLEFAISRLSHIENIKDHSKYVPAFIPLLAAYLTMFFNFNEQKWMGLVFATVTIICIVYIVAVDRRNRNIAVSVLKTFELIKARKEKDMSVK